MIFENIDDGIIVVDERASIIYANGIVEAVSSIAPRDLIGRKIYSTPFLKDDFDQLMRKLVRMKSDPNLLRWIQIEVEGGTRLLSVNYRLLEDNRHQNRYLLLVIRNKSKYKIDEDKLERLEFLEYCFNTIALPFFVIDADSFVIEMANDAARRMGHVLNAPCYVVHNRKEHCCGANYRCPAAEVIKYKRTVSTEHIHYDKDGRQIYMEVYAYPVFDKKGEVRKVVKTLIDRTRRRQREKILDALQRRLKAKGDILNEKSIAMRQILDQIDDEKGRIKTQIKSNMEKIVNPMIRGIKAKADPELVLSIELLEKALEEVTSPFVNELEQRFNKLAPREIEVCNMIKNGLSSKEIADELNLSVETVKQQRKLIRRKMGVTNRKVNLSSYLGSLS